jgi:hypothetical protein
MPFLTNCTKLAQINAINNNGNVSDANTLPELIKKIRDNCFRGTAIKEIDIISATSLGANIFRDCESLQKVWVRSGATIADGAFSYIPNSCVIIYKSYVTDWTWNMIAYSPNLYVEGTSGVIGWCGDSGDSPQDFLYWTIDQNRKLTIECAFDGWDKFRDKQLIKTHRWNDWATANSKPITSITLSQVYALGAEEFKGMTGVKSVTLNDGLTSIGASAFEGCTSLTSITIPAGVTSIGADAFKGCTKLTTVIINGNPTIAAGAFPSTATVTMTQTANAADGVYWMTFYNPGANFQADASTTVYKGTISSSSLVLTEVEDRIVNASTAVILKSTSEHPVMTRTTTATSDTNGNDLVGTMTDQATPANCYTLSSGSQGVGFYRYTGTTVKAGKAYLIYGSSLARGFLSFGGDDSATDIKDTKGSDTSVSSAVYTLDGRRLQGEPSKKGVYVRNGQKFIIK